MVAQTLNKKVRLSFFGIETPLEVEFHLGPKKLAQTPEHRIASYQRTCG